MEGRRPFMPDSALNRRSGSARRLGLTTPTLPLNYPKNLFTVHVVLQSPVASSSHGTIHAAFRRVAALCIPLLRPNRHQRLLERIVSARASGSFLSPDPRSSNPEQGGAQPAYQ